MQSTNIQSLIYKNYLKSSLVPILLIETMLLLLYFGINFYISERNRETLLDEATKNIEEISSREVNSINRQLLEVNSLALILQRDHQSFFTNPAACFLPNEKPKLSVHANGAFYKSANNGGASLYYANTTQIGEKERRKALCSEMLDPLLKSIVDTNSIVTQAYLNTWDDMNRLYPYMDDAPSQYGSAIHMEDYNFYYEADSKHDPERKPVWTGAYLDPAGQGWMVSLIVPIYNNNFLEGVSGLDVTISSFVQNILELKFPWDAGTFMLDKSGTILAMQNKVEQILNIKELGDHTYSEKVKQTIEKPKEFNLLNSTDPLLKAQFNQLFNAKSRIATIVIHGVEYLVSQEIVNETGWRMMTLIEKSRVFAPITRLKSLSDKIGLIAIGTMVLFYTVFFMYLVVKSKKLTGMIAAPITKLSDLTRDLGKHLKSEQLELSGITEVDILTKNFNTMSQELNKAINEALAARQEADSVISNFLDSLLVVDNGLRISRVNRETCHLLGYGEGELTNQPVTILFEEPETQIASYFNFPFRAETQDKIELRNVELTFVAKDGGRLPVSINLARVTSKSGATVGVVAGAKDISELKEAFRQAEQQKQFIQNIIDTIPGGLLVLDREFRLNQSNDTYNRLVCRWSDQYGFTKEVLDAQILVSLAEKIGERQQSGEIVLHGSLDELIVEFHASSGGIGESGDRRVIFLHDITSRRKTEAMRLLQATVLEQTSEGIIITDTKGIIQNCNLAAQTMSGHDSQALIGQKTSLFKSGIHDAEYYRHLWETVQKGDVWSGSITNCRRDGSLFETEMTVSPVRSTGREITHYVSLWRDISQVRNLQQQLLQAQKLEAIGQLAAGVAHEINTPIQYILSNLNFFEESFADLAPLLDALRNGRQKIEQRTDSEWSGKLALLIEEAGLEFLCEEIPKGIEDAIAGVKHVARIVMALKEFSHPGKEKSWADLNRLIDNALIVAQNELKHIAEVETSFDPDLPALFCEPGAVSQILLNLIINARDAIAEKGNTDSLGKILLSTRLLGSAIELQISDNGVGIPPEILNRIFDPFFTTKPIGKGSGQGLSIAYDIVVNKHQGSITCESTPGQGTTMIIQFTIKE